MVWSNKHHRLVLPHSSQLCSLTSLSTDLKPLLLSSYFFLGKMVKYYIKKKSPCGDTLNDLPRTIKVRFGPSAKSLQSWLCDPTNCSPPGSSVGGCLQARLLEWVDILQGIFLTRDGTHISCVSCTVGRFFSTEPSGKPIKVRLAKAEYDNYN